MKKLIVSLLSMALLASIVFAGCAKPPSTSTPNPSLQSPASPSTPASSPTAPLPTRPNPGPQKPPSTSTPSPSPQSPTAPLPTRPSPGPQKPPLEVTAIVDKAGYSLGEEVKINFTFKNVSSSSVQIQPFPPIVEIMRASSNETVRSFPAGVDTESLNSGEAATYVVTWDQRDSQKQPVTYGYYCIELGDIQVGEWHMKPSFGMIAPILILPAEGTMEKTIEVNQTQKVGEISITLERLELSASGMKVYVFNTPPGYSLPQGSQLAPPQTMISAFAEYSVDGGIVKQAGPSAIRFLDKGMEHVWENLDPVPKTAKELAFRITKLGDWQGPWEFLIPLEP